MTRWISLVALLALLQGCATQLAVRPETATEDPGNQTQTAVLLFQSNEIAPAHGDAPLDPEALQPGDILLTSVPTLVSATIRLMTFAPVSHAAVYVGDGQIVEAVRSGVRVRAIEQTLEEESVVLVLRHPELTAEQAARIKDYAVQKSGSGFNFLGITLNVPVSVGRRVCELPLVPAAARDLCLRSMGLIHLVTPSESQLFCSQLVLQAYQHADVPITDVDPRLISPADLLHMREGDVSSVRIRRQLHYVGFLKYEQPVSVALKQ